MPFHSALLAQSVPSGWKLLQDLKWSHGQYSYIVRQGEVTDLASIPPGLRWYVSNHDYRIRRPAALHDSMIKRNAVQRKRADYFFNVALAEEGVGKVKRSLMYYAVCTYRIWASLKNKVANEFKR